MCERLFPVGDPAVWTRTTNDSWTDGGLFTCEPQACADLSLGSSAASDCGGTLYSHTCTVSCPSGYVASDMDDAVFQCLAPPGFPDGTLPRCVLQVCTGQEFDGLEGIAHTCDGVGLGDKCGAEGAYGVAETHLCVWKDSTSSKLTILCDVLTLHKKRHCHLRRELRGQVECNSIDHSD